jgi:membrane dipeptidase
MGVVSLTNSPASAAARGLMQQSLVWDIHGCMPLRPGDETFLPQLERYRSSGVDVCSLNIGFDVTPWPNAVLVAATFRRFIQQRPDDYLLIETVADIERARTSGRLGVFFDLEGGCALNDQVAMVEVYYRLGVRWMLFAYNKNNSLGGGCDDDDQGLTRFGRQVLNEMRNVGMIVCCTHTGERTVLEIMEHSGNPVIFSHSNPRALKNHYRNISDRAIRACAQTGGVISVVGIGDFLGDNDNRTETVVQHIDYLVQLVGPDHVGLGLDYVFDEQELRDYLKNNPQVFPPEKYSEGIRMVAPEQTPEIASGLLERGYAPDAVKKILGENHLRVASHVWR